VFITIEDLQFHVEIKGEGPPLIGFHGFAENSSTWEALELTGRQLILPDLTGHGLSAKPDRLKPYTLPIMLNHLHQLIHRLGYSKYFLLGYSLGGRLALAYALTYPEEVQGLILESSSYGIEDENERKKRRRQDLELAKEIRDKGVEWFEGYWSSLPLFTTQTRLPMEIRAKIRERRLGNVPHALANTLLGVGHGIYPCFKEQVPRLTLPTLYIHGEEDEKYQNIGQQLQKLNPQIQKAVVPGAGHNTHLEKPEIFTGLVQAFLDKHI